MHHLINWKNWFRLLGSKRWSFSASYARRWDYEGLIGGERFGFLKNVEPDWVRSVRLD
jgi:hypothetical protein